MIENLRRMTVSDIDAVYAIELKSHIAPWSKQILCDCVLVGYECWVLELLDGQTSTIAAYLIARYADNLSHILNLCVEKNLQTKGYGRKLLTHFIANVSNYSNITALTLEVRPSNHIALNLYASLGFMQTSIKPGYYVGENGIEDAIVLEKKLRAV